jgi:hypothetical protein
MISLLFVPTLASAAAPSLVSRSAFLRRAALIAAPAPLLHTLPVVSAEPPPFLAVGDNGVVMGGVLQMVPALAERVPAGSVATVAIRVVGRNLKGPLAQVQVPVEATEFPVSYTIPRSSLRDGLPDYIWLEEDIYVFAEVVTPTGKKLAEGRSKAKFVSVDGQPAHKVAALSLE